MYLTLPEEVPPASVTTTESSPSAWTGVLAVISVAETTTTSLAALPIVTVAPETKPLPLIVTEVPPRVVPELGSTEETVGGDRATNSYPILSLG